MSQLYPDPPARLATLSWRSALAFVGPGVIIASVTIGSGELVWASRSGAIFGYKMLWCFLLAGVFKGVQVYTASRYITLTGEHPMTSWRYIPGPPAWFPIMLALPTLAVMPIAFSAISETLGGYAYELSGQASEGPSVGAFTHVEFWENVWATLILTTCLVLAVSSSLTTLERASAVVLGVLVTCALLAVILCRPNLGETFIGLIWPRVPDYEPWVLEKYSKSFVDRSPWLEVALYLTAVGGGTFDYVGYVGMLRDKKWGLAGAERPATRAELEQALDDRSPTGADELRRARHWIRAPFLDTSISFSLVIFVTLLFALLGALVLHSRQVIPDQEHLLSQQESYLTLLHPQLNWVYRAGVFLAFIGTLYGAFEVYRRTLLESVRALAPASVSSGRELVLGRLMLAYCYLGGMIMLWLPRTIAGDVVNRMTFGAVVGGATLCGLWCFAMLWTDRVRLPKQLRMGRVLWLFTLSAGVVMTGLGVQTMYVYFSSKS